MFYGNLCHFMKSSCHILSDVILTHPPSYSVNQGQVPPVDRDRSPSFSLANLEGMYIFRKNKFIVDLYPQNTIWKFSVNLKKKRSELR